MKHPTFLFLRFSTCSDGNSTRPPKSWFAISGILVALAVALVLPTGAEAATKYKILHAFHTGDGAGPAASLALDASGNLYTTTASGGDGNPGHGTVIELIPSQDGNWTESVLYRFTGGKDGGYPWASLTFDATGSLYGTTQGGGNLSGCNGYGCGVVFGLASNQSGGRTQSVLYEFTGGKDGEEPNAGVVLDAAGNLYGTTTWGGGGSKCSGGLGCGVVFELTPNNDGTWAETLLHKFTGGKDGAFPFAGLTLDAAGNLYGTTYLGGNLSDCAGVGCGVIFRLIPNQDGSWTEKVLHTLTGGKDGGAPSAGLILDTAGSLYGTTEGGGNLSDCFGGCGVVFELTSNQDGSWTEKVLHKFTDGKDGAYPFASLVFDAAGNLYGTTQDGGNPGSCSDRLGCGMVFKLTPNQNGRWTEKVLHIFNGSGGENPTDSLIFDTSGNLYGTAQGGTGGKGVVFEITP